MDSGLSWGKVSKDSNALRISLQDMALSCRRDIINDCVEMPPGTFFDTTFTRDNPDYRVFLILLEIGCGRDVLQCTEADKLNEVSTRRAKRIEAGGHAVNVKSVKKYRAKIVQTRESYPVPVHVFISQDNSFDYVGSLSKDDGRPGEADVPPIVERPPGLTLILRETAAEKAAAEKAAAKKAAAKKAAAEKAAAEKAAAEKAAVEKAAAEKIAAEKAAAPTATTAIAES